MNEKIKRIISWLVLVSMLTQNVFVCNAENMFELGDIVETTSTNYFDAEEATESESEEIVDDEENEQEENEQEENEQEENEQEENEEEIASDSLTDETIENEDDESTSSEIDEPDEENISTETTIPDTASASNLLGFVPTPEVTNFGAMTPTIEFIVGGDSITLLDGEPGIRYPNLLEALASINEGDETTIRAVVPDGEPTYELHSVDLENYVIPPNTKLTIDFCDLNICAYRTYSGGDLFTIRENADFTIKNYRCYDYSENNFFGTCANMFYCEENVKLTIDNFTLPFKCSQLVCLSHETNNIDVTIKNFEENYALINSVLEPIEVYKMIEAVDVENVTVNIENYNGIYGMFRFQSCKNVTVTIQDSRSFKDPDMTLNYNDYRMKFETCENISLDCKNSLMSSRNGFITVIYDPWLLGTKNLNINIDGDGRDASAGSAITGVADEPSIGQYLMYLDSINSDVNGQIKIKNATIWTDREFIKFTTGSIRTDIENVCVKYGLDDHHQLEDPFIDTSFGDASDIRFISGKLAHAKTSTPDERIMYNVQPYLSSSEITVDSEDSTYYYRIEYVAQIALFKIDGNDTAYYLNDAIANVTDGGTIRYVSDGIGYINLGNETIDLSRSGISYTIDFQEKEIDINASSVEDVNSIFKINDHTNVSIRNFNKCVFLSTDDPDSIVWDAFFDITADGKLTLDNFIIPLSCNIFVRVREPLGSADRVVLLSNIIEGEKVKVPCRIIQFQDSLTVKFVLDGYELEEGANGQGFIACDTCENIEGIIKNVNMPRREMANFLSITSNGNVDIKLSESLFNQKSGGQFININATILTLLIDGVEVREIGNSGAGGAGGVIPVLTTQADDYFIQCEVVATEESSITVKNSVVHKVTSFIKIVQEIFNVIITNTDITYNVETSGSAAGGIGILIGPTEDPGTDQNARLVAVNNPSPALLHEKIKYKSGKIKNIKLGKSEDAYNDIIDFVDTSCTLTELDSDETYDYKIENNSPVLFKIDGSDNTYINLSEAIADVVDGDVIRCISDDGIFTLGDAAISLDAPGKTYTIDFQEKGFNLKLEDIENKLFSLSDTTTNVTIKNFKNYSYFGDISHYNVEFIFDVAKGDLTLDNFVIPCNCTNMLYGQNDSNGITINLINVSESEKVTGKYCFGFANMQGTDDIVLDGGRLDHIYFTFDTCDEVNLNIKNNFSLIYNTLSGDHLDQLIGVNNCHIFKLNISDASIKHRSLVNVNGNTDFIVMLASASIISSQTAIKYSRTETAIVSERARIYATNSNINVTLGYVVQAQNIGLEAMMENVTITGIEAGFMNLTNVVPYGSDSKLKNFTFISGSQHFIEGDNVPIHIYMQDVNITYGEMMGASYDNMIFMDAHNPVPTIIIKSGKFRQYGIGCDPNLKSELEQMLDDGSEVRELTGSDYDFLIGNFAPALFKIDGNDTTYNQLSAAIAAVPNGGTIRCVSDDGIFEIGSDTIQLDPHDPITYTIDFQSKAIKLDIKGMSGSEHIFLLNKEESNVTIKNFTNYGYIDDTPPAAINWKRLFELSGGKITLENFDIPMKRLDNLIYFNGGKSFEVKFKNVNEKAEAFADDGEMGSSNYYMCSFIGTNQPAQSAKVDIEGGRLDKTGFAFSNFYSIEFNVKEFTRETEAFASGGSGFVKFSGCENITTNIKESEIHSNQSIINSISNMANAIYNIASSSLICNHGETVIDINVSDNVSQTKLNIENSYIEGQGIIIMISRGKVDFTVDNVIAKSTGKYLFSSERMEAESTVYLKNITFTTESTNFMRYNNDRGSNTVLEDVDISYGLPGMIEPWDQKLIEFSEEATPNIRIISGKFRHPNGRCEGFLNEILPYKDPMSLIIDTDPVYDYIVRKIETVRFKVDNNDSYIFDDLNDAVSHVSNNGIIDCIPYNDEIVGVFILGDEQIVLDAPGKTYTIDFHELEMEVIGGTAGNVFAIYNTDTNVTIKNFKNYIQDSENVHSALFYMSGGSLTLDNFVIPFALDYFIKKVNDGSVNIKLKNVVESIPSKLSEKKISASGNSSITTIEFDIEDTNLDGFIMDIANNKEVNINISSSSILFGRTFTPEEAVPSGNPAMQLIANENISINVSNSLLKARENTSNVFSAGRGKNISINIDNNSEIICVPSDSMMKIESNDPSYTGHIDINDSIISVVYYDGAGMPLDGDERAVIDVKGFITGSTMNIKNSTFDTNSCKILDLNDSSCDTIFEDVNMKYRGSCIDNDSSSPVVIKSGKFIDASNGRTEPAYQHLVSHKHPDSIIDELSIGDEYDYAIYRKKLATVSYLPNGGEGETPPVATEGYMGTKDLIVSENNFTAPRGMYFDKWKDQESGAIYYPGDIIEVAVDTIAYLEAQWAPHTYRVNLHGSDGTYDILTDGTPVLYEKYGVGFFSEEACTSTMSSIEKPTRHGYTFDGYYLSTDSDCSGDCYINADGDIIAASDTFAASPSELTAKWKPQEYTITLDDNGGETSGTEYIYGVYNTGLYEEEEHINIITTISYPTKTGYKFAGYYVEGDATQYIDEDGNIIFDSAAFAEDKTMKASWSEVIYHITLNNNGADEAGTESIYEKYNIGFYSDEACTTEISSITIPSKAGHIFKGYYPNDTAPNSYINDYGNISATNTTFTEDTELIARWEPETYVITLNNNGAMIDGTAFILEKYGIGIYGSFSSIATISTISCPVKPGSIFVGYYHIDDTSYSNKYIDEVGNINFGSTEFTESVILKASWSDTVHTVILDPGPSVDEAGTVNLYIKHGNGVYSDSNGTIATASIVIPSKTGSVFKGYYLTSDISFAGTCYINEDGNISNLLDSFTGPVGLTARWEAKTYYIQLESSGATTPPNPPVIFGKYGVGLYSLPDYAPTSSISNITPPTKTDATFVGFFDTSYTNCYIDSSGNLLFNSEEFETDTILKASWSEVEIYYNIVLDNDGATESGTTALYAKNGGDIFSNPEYTIATTSIVLPSKAGHIFRGYYNTLETDPVCYINTEGVINSALNGFVSEVTLKARWEAKTYMILLNSAGGTTPDPLIMFGKYGVGLFSSMDYAPTSSISSIIPPTKTGYNFKGFYVDPYDDTTCKIASSGNLLFDSEEFESYTELIASWSAIVNTITLSVGEGAATSITTLYKKYNAGIYTDISCEDAYATTSIATPTKTGNIFRGYYLSTDTTFAGVCYISETGAVNTSALNAHTTDITLVAKWEIDPAIAGLATISYLPGEGSGSMSPTVGVPTDGGLAAATNTFIAPIGKHFSKWLEDGTSNYYTEGQIVPISDGTEKVLIAQWEENTYYVELDSNGATIAANPIMIYGKYGVGLYNAPVYDAAHVVSSIIPPTKTGSTFAGFYLDSDTSFSGTCYIDSTGTINFTSTDFTANAILKASWSSITNEITLSVGAGATTSITTLYGTGGSGIYTDAARTVSATNIAIPTKTGNIFRGYYLSTDTTFAGVCYISETGVVNTSALNAHTTDITLVAKWEASTYYIELNNNGGTTMANPFVIYGKYGEGLYSLPVYDAAHVVSTITPPTKTGSTFAGFYLDSDTSFSGTCYIDSTGTINFTSTDFTANAILKASWSSITNEITLSVGSGATTSITTLYGTGGSGIYTDAARTISATNIAIPTKTGNIFRGYYLSTDTSFTGVCYISETGVVNTSALNAHTTDITLVAKWEAVVYTVTLNNDGGSTTGFTSLFVKYGVGIYSNYTCTSAPLTSITPPTKAGSVFGGFYIDPTDPTATCYIDNSGNILFNNTQITSDTTLKAKWDALPSTPVATLSYLPNGGGGSMAPTVNAAASLTSPTVQFIVPSCAFTAPSGMHFVKWKDQATGTEYNVGATLNIPVNTEAVLIAQWEADPTPPPTGVATISYLANGGGGSMSPTVGVPTGGGLAAATNTFTAPTGKHFTKWLKSGTSAEYYMEGQNVPITAGTEIVLVAQWENDPVATGMATVSYLPGEGSGSISPVEVTLYDGASSIAYVVVNNPFTAPAGKHFVNWKNQDTGEVRNAGASITILNGTTTVFIAQWADDGGGGSGSGSGSGGGGSSGGRLPFNNNTSPIEMPLDIIWNIDLDTGALIAHDTLGNLCVGWKYITKNGKNGYTYFNVDGTQYKGLLVENGRDYFFDNEGWLVNNQKDAGIVNNNIPGNINNRGTWYFDQNINTYKYYILTDEGHVEPARNKWFTDNITGSELWYAVDKDGNMLTGLVKEKENYYYLQESGLEKGSMVANTSITLDGMIIYVDSEGKIIGDTSMLNAYKIYDMEKAESLTNLNVANMNTTTTVSKGGFYTLADGKTCYIKESINERGEKVLEPAVGVTNVGDEYYYFSQKGEMLTGLQTVNGKQYYFSDDQSYYGKLYCGYVNIDGHTYYCDAATGGIATRID